MIKASSTALLSLSPHQNRLLCPYFYKSSLQDNLGFFYQVHENLPISIPDPIPKPLPHL